MPPMMIADMIVKASQVAARLKTLSHAKRLVLLCYLTEGEQAVGELARLTGMRDAAVSQQLMLLRKDGVVEVRREGQMAFYRIVDADTQAIMAFLYSRFCVAPKAKKKGN